MRRALLLVPFVALVVGAVSPGAQEPVRVEARVVAVSGESVYLDRGREAGIEKDDRVLLHRPGAATVEALILDVSRSTSRAETLPGSPPIDVGTRAEVLVPAERLEKRAKAAPPAPTVPESAPASRPAPPPPHPPWTRPPENWNRDAPLLAPAFGRGASETPAHLSGRVYTLLTGTWDSQGEGRRYFLGRLGTDARLENLFGRGGSLEFQGELLRQDASVSGGADETENSSLVRRLSYAEGGTREAPTRWEVGRFLQREFPELGMVDGLDASYRFASGSRLGFNAGRMPEPFTRLDPSEDTEASVYYRHAFDPAEKLRLGLAYQNTWHRGEQDRNLVLASLDARPGPGFSFRSAAWVDYYGGEDTIKSHGFELTELQALAAWRFDQAGGLGLSVSHRRVPELLRTEFLGLTPQQVRSDRFDRGGAYAWWAPTRLARVTARADLWEDQDDHGARGEVGLSWRDLLYPRGEVGWSVFTVDGSTTSGEGFRVSANRSFDAAFASLGYEWTRFDAESVGGSLDPLTHHAVFVNADLRLGRRWNLSLLGDRRFGDELDAITLSLLLQARF